MLNILHKHGVAKAQRALETLDKPRVQETGFHDLAVRVQGEEKLRRLREEEDTERQTIIIITMKKNNNEAEGEK